ncbi:MAG TPA: S8 family serine peptidase [Candidatus Nanoarchaeia archaeon]
MFHKVPLFRVLVIISAVILFLILVVLLVSKFAESKPIEIRAKAIESSINKEELLVLSNSSSAKVLGVSNKVEITKEFPAKQTEFGFNAAVVSWEENLPEGSEVYFEVSSSEDNKNWSGWQKAEEDQEAAGKSPTQDDSKFSRLLVVYGKHIKYRVRLIVDQGEVGSLEKIKSTYVNSKGSFWDNFWAKLSKKVLATSSLFKNAFAATANKKATDPPAIISRKGWRADPKLMKWGPEYVKTKKIIVHHTVTPQNDADPAATIRAIYYFHAVLRRWGDIGYNFLIDKNGNIYEGRFGGDSVVGGHARPYNYGSVGVAVLGDYRFSQPNKPIMNALQQIAVWKSASHGFDPAGSSRFGSRGFEKTFSNITYHGGLTSTECAGRNLNKFVPKLRVLARQMPLEALVLYKNGALQRVAYGKNRLIGDVLKGLRGASSVATAEPNYIRRMADFPSDGSGPNDANYPTEWYLKTIKQNFTWQYSSGASSVKVAVIDTGVAYENYLDKSGKYSKLLDFAETNFDTTNAYDFVNKDTHANDDNGHGTAVTDIIAASTNNTLANAAIAPRVTILPIKALNKVGFGTDSDLASAIDWAVSKGAKIINLSLGGPDYSTVLARYTARAYSKGLVIVASAGNSGTSRAFYPAASKYVLGVGATRFNNTRAYYSSYGSWLDLFAPGGDLRADQNKDGKVDGLYLPTISAKSNNYTKFKYSYLSGTSFSAPQVSALASLIASRGVSRNDVIERLIFHTTKDLGGRGVDAVYRYGLVQTPLAVFYANPDTLHTNGTLVKASGYKTVYLLDQGKKRPISSSVFSNTPVYKTKNIVPISRYELSLFPVGSRVVYPDGSLIKGSTGPIYVISNGEKKAFASTSIFSQMGYRTANIITVSDSVLSWYPIGVAITSVLSTHPDGSLVKAAGAIYYIEGGKRRAVSAAVFPTRFNTNQVISITTGEASRYSVGEPLTFPDGTLLKNEIGKIWLVSTPTGSTTQVKRTFRWWTSLTGNGYKSTNIITTSDELLAKYPVGNKIY